MKKLLFPLFLISAFTTAKAQTSLSNDCDSAIVQNKKIFKQAYSFYSDTDRSLSPDNKYNHPDKISRLLEPLRRLDSATLVTVIKIFKDDTAYYGNILRKADFFDKKLDTSLVKTKECQDRLPKDTALTEAQKKSFGRTLSDHSSEQGDLKGNLADLIKNVTKMWNGALGELQKTEGKYADLMNPAGGKKKKKKN